MFFNRKYSPRDKNIDWTQFASSESASNCLPPRFYPKENLWTMPEIDYESPIKIIQDKMRMQIEDDIYKVIKDYDIQVDKDELIKALKYDRQQYDKGFKDGVRKFVEMWKEETSKREIIWDTDEAMDILAEKLVNANG